MTADLELVALPPCPAGGANRADLLAGIDKWIRSEAMARLVHAFGGTLPTGTLEGALTYLEPFSDVWNSRRDGLERGEITSADYSADVIDVIDASATALGLTGRQRPACSRYDHVLVLGGGMRTALARSQFAADLCAAGIKADHVSALTSLRALGPTEIEFGRTVGITGLVVEADAMAAALIRAFDLRGPCTERSGVTQQNAEWWTREYNAAGGKAYVVAAPTSNPPYRANTGDTLTGWGELICEPKSTERVLVVTTDLFVPFQHCDAVRLLGLPFGCEIETVGLDPLRFAAWLQPSTTSAVLQEVCWAIHSMIALYEECV